MGQGLPRAEPGDGYSAIVAAPGFALGLSCSADEVTAIDFLPPQAERNSTNPLAMETMRQLKAYLADPAFVFALPLRPAGTTFQRRGCGSRFRPFPWARPKPTGPWPKPCTTPPGPWARPAVPTTTPW